MSDQRIRTLTWIGLTISIVTSSCTSEEGAFPTRELENKIGYVDLTPVLEIGRDESSEDSVLGQPTYLVVDGRGQIYVADLASMNIKVFDQAGRFLRLIASRGEGPGEIRDVSSMSIYEDSILSVYDQRNRKISNFQLDGTWVSDWTCPADVWLAPDQFHVEEFDRQEIVAIDKSAHTREYTGSIFHRVNFKSGEHDVWLDYDEAIDGTSSDIEKWIAESRVGSYVVHGDSVYFAPALYRGKVMGTSKDNDSSSSWNETRVTLPFSVTPFSILDSQGKSLADMAILADMAKLGSGSNNIQYAIAFDNQSLGLFKSRNDLIVHVTFVSDERSTKRSLGVELIDGGSMEHLGYTVVRDVDRKGGPGAAAYLNESFFAMDSENRLYSINTDHDVPLVIAYQLSVN